MARHLGFCEGRGSHSAGNTRPPPSTPRLPGLRRGSHNAPHSTAADCWQPRIWHLTGYAYGAGCRLFVRSRDRNQRPMSLMPEPKNFQSLFQIQRRQTYEYGWRAAPPTAWSRRQCRKHPDMAQKPTLSAALGGPHDVCQGIIRWQAAGFSRFPVQRVGVGLRAASRSRRNLDSVLCALSVRCATRLPGPAVTNGIFMRMAGQLLDAQRCLPDSAGKIF